MPKTLLSIGSGAFASCNKLSSITIPKNVKSIGEGAFSACPNLKSVTSHVREPIEISHDCFKLDYNDTFVNAVLYVPAGARKQYESIAGWKIFRTIIEMEPESPYEILDDNTAMVKSLEPDATGIVVIPETVEIDGETYRVTAIASEAFMNNKELKEVTIPGTVTVIGEGAFAGCENLAAIHIQSETPVTLVKVAARRQALRADGTIPSQFEGIDFEKCVLYVPYGAEEAYREAEGWKLFTHIVGVHSEKDPVALVTAKNYSREYGEENPAFEFTVEGVALDGEPVIECAATAASDAGEYDIIIKKGTVKNYNDSYVSGKLTITKAPLKVGVKDAEREQGTENPQFEIVYEGWKLTDTESVLTKKPTAATTATKDSPAGEYDITVSGGEAKNYELSYTSGKLTVLESSGISNILTGGSTVDIFTTTGVLVKKDATTLKGLKKGVYIVNGRKVVVK